MRLRSLAVPALVAIIAPGCDLITGSESGAVRIVVATSGQDFDADGYMVRVDDRQAAPTRINDVIIVGGLSPGPHIVRTENLARNCALNDVAARTVNVVADQTVDAVFDITCSLSIGTVRVVVESYGIDVDPDGYTAIVDGVIAGVVEPNGVLFVDSLRSGAHSVTLTGIADNCSPTPPTRTETVHFESVTDASYVVKCNRITGRLRVIAATSGDDVDSDGYVVTVADGNALPQGSVSANGSVVIEELGVGERTVTLTNVDPNCSVIGANPRTVVVAGNQTAEATFNVSCVALATLRVIVATSGVDPDPSGYSVRVTRQGVERTAELPANGSVSVAKLAAGQSEVTLEGIAANCDVSAANPRAVTLAIGATSQVTFDVVCAEAAQLAYAYHDGLRSDIYVAKVNGTAVTRLTKDGLERSQPAWSPDGSRIAFRSQLGSNSDVYVMNASGESQVRLTTASGTDEKPAWSPDGARIAFVSDRLGYRQIWVMNAADGSDAVRLSNLNADDGEPSWSPDGSRIAFRRDVSGNADIYVMNADGSNVTRLTSNPAWEGQPSWSPDGSKIAFVREVNCPNACAPNIFIMNTDGSALLWLESSTDDSEPAWSPDGRWIAFTSVTCSPDSYYYYYNCSSGVFAMKPNGRGRVEILAGQAASPAWRR